MRRTREPIPNHVAREVYKRDGRTCRYCGDMSGPFHLDHVYPVSKGGETSVGNLVVACQHCNQTKNAKIGIWPMPAGYFKTINAAAQFRRDLWSESIRYYLQLLAFSVFSVSPLLMDSELSGIVEDAAMTLWLVGFVVAVVYMARHWPWGWQYDFIEGEGRYSKEAKSA